MSATARQLRQFRVCHLATGPLSDGAARGALTLHQALLDANCASTLITDIAGSGAHAGVVQLPSLLHPKLDQSLRRSLDHLPVRLYPRRAKALFTTGLWGRSVSKIVDSLKADIINLHWVGGGFISARSLRLIDAPVVWTLRDLWPATGGCHHPTVHHCDHFTHGCGRCPHLSSNSRIDLSRLVCLNKARFLPRDLTVVGISEWVANEARRSAIFRGREVTAIPNCIDTEAFKPIDRTLARRLLGLPVEGRLVLAGAITPGDPYRGFPLLLQALANVKGDFQTILFGNVSSEQLSSVPRVLRSFGFVQDDLKLRAIYSAADVFVSSATSEAFGKTIAESLACGTPAVAFAATGPREVVSHQDSGYLANPFDPRSLAQGIEWVLAHPSPELLHQSARGRAESCFSKPRAAAAYLELYSRLLERSNRRLRV